MNGNNAKNLFTKTAGLVGGVSAALLLSLPALAQQGPVDSNSNTAPTPAPAAPNTYSPSTGDPTIRIAPGSENSNSVDRTENPNSVQQPAGRSRVQDRSTGNTSTQGNEVNGASSQTTNDTMGQYRTGQYQTQDIRALQAPAWRSRFDDRSTGINQKNYDRLAGVDNDDSMLYRNSTSSGNSVRTESRRTETNNSSSPYNTQMDGNQTKQLQSDSPNQQNPNLGSSDGSGATGNRVNQTNQNNQRTFDQMGGSSQSPSSTPQSTDQTGGTSPSTSGTQQSTDQNYGTRTGIEQRTRTVNQQRKTTTTVDQQGGSNVNTNSNTTNQPSGGQAGSEGAGGQGTGSQSVPGLW